MKALITGSAGFLGRHFSAELKARGYLDFRSDATNGTDVHRVFTGDLYSGMVFDLVVHCAAVEPHRAAIDGNPMHLASNLLLDAGLFEWAVRTGQTRVLYISSSAAYPINLQDDLTTAGPLREDDIRLAGREDIGMPDAGYGWLKITGERLAADAARTGMPVHIVRPFSGYGEDQGIDWPFGAFAARARRQENPFVIWGDGTQVRDWIHVSDLVAGALEVVERDVREPVNLCTGIGTSMSDLVRMMLKLTGTPENYFYDGDKPTGVQCRVGDPTRMREIYTPKVSLDEGVERALWTTSS